MTVPSRRRFVATIGAILLTPTLSTQLRASTSARKGGPHPKPRDGVSAAKVAPRDKLADRPKAVAGFDQVREIPAILDGIRCQCGCTDGKAYYSLLSCFELPDMMAADCEICQGQARLAHRLHKAGKTLDEIRRGIDARYG